MGSTLSRNLAVMQDKGWISAVETSPTGRTMSVAIADRADQATTGLGTIPARSA